MWMLAILLSFAALVCIVAFVRGSSVSYWDHPRLLERQVGRGDPDRRKGV